MNSTVNRARVAGTGALALAVLLCAAPVSAQTPAPAKKPAARPAATAKPAPQVAPAAAAAPAPLPSGKGWRSGPAPAWVVEPAGPPPGLAAAPAAGARREQVFDMQMNYALPKPQSYLRLRSVALEASALGSVSQPQVAFNPAYQTVVLHSVAVLRDGRRIERLADARIDLMRREQRLEQQVIDGTETLLVVVNDVRVGEPVEVAYTLEGENPIFEGRIATGARLGYETPVDLMHWRLTVPAGRELQVKTLAGAPEPERLTEGGLQVLRVLRHQVAAVPSEQQTPPWFKAFPAVLASEYRNWGEVDAWAQRLFALPAPAHPSVVARAQAFRATGLQGAALVSEVLRFVQDEVRYFSVSLGESSHRPKPPQQTLADLLGDCKDKVQLLDALLRELGFDAKPALVSTVRNRGLAEFLPGHDEFDHVVTFLQLDGRSWLLDTTINGQGLTLATRGMWPYGRALVVGGGGELVVAAEPPDALHKLEFEQRWDLSRPGQPTLLTTTMRAHGMSAERWRAGAAAGGVQRLAEALAGMFARVAPGIEAVGAPELVDDRQANVLQLRQTFRHPDFGDYNRGVIEADFAAIELLEALTGPPEVRRRTPYMIDQPRSVDSRIVVLAPQTLSFKAPAPQEIVDRHFRYSARLDVAGNTVTATRRFERRADQVLPADLDGYRENVLRARGGTTGRLRLALFDPAGMTPEFELTERRLRNSRGWRNDTLGSILARNEFGRLIDGKALERAEPGSVLAAKVRASRAQANNLLGDFNLGLLDADAALAIRPQLEPALEARAVALLGNGQAEAALAEFTRLAQLGGRRATVAAWMGALHFHLGRDAEAEKLLREAVDGGGGDEREYALIWLYLAAERQGGRGKAAVESYVEGTDATRLTGALLRHFSGRIDRDAVLKVARAKPELERLNMAEATFYIGQQFVARGQREEGLRWFARTVETEATPYREVTFARLELQRGK